MLEQLSPAPPTPNSECGFFLLYPADCSSWASNHQPSDWQKTLSHSSIFHVLISFYYPNIQVQQVTAVLYIFVFLEILQSEGLCLDVNDEPNFLLTSNSAASSFTDTWMLLLTQTEGLDHSCLIAHLLWETEGAFGPGSS